MTASAQFNLFGFQVSVRFIQGYRYLDRCGECLICLEDKLDEGWIPVETSPTSDTMKNETMGLTMTFNSEGMNVRQAEYLEFDTFRDQSCKAYDILCRLLSIERISAPTLRVWYQKGFDENEEDDAEQYLLTMGLYETDQRLLHAMGGREAGSMFTLITELSAPLDDVPVDWRRRLQANVVKQLRQQNFDSRLLQRTRLLGERQGDAIRGMQRLRKRQPDVAPIAVQLEAEVSLNMELSTKQFNMPDFMHQSNEWAEHVKDSVVALKRS